VLDFSSEDHSIIAIGSIAIFKFPKVNANDLTENLVIKIAKIDGMDAGIAGERGYIRIAEEYNERINQIRQWEQMNVIIPYGVTSIDALAFYGKGLISVIIPKGITSIGESAFSNNKLTSVVIPDSVRKIGWYAFGKNPITKITIPANVEMLGSSVDPSTFPPNSFENEFTEYYNRTGKQAGTYVYQNRTWVKQ
jgi:hypothetical protein